jgi:hypothetical protein
VHLAEAASEYVPALQALHSVEPGVAYDPALQTVQAVEARLAAYLPATHSSHSVVLLE